MLGNNLNLRTKSITKINKQKSLRTKTQVRKSWKITKHPMTTTI